MFGLYCVNHQRFLPPHNRQNPPFNKTQIQDALNDDRGLISTYELFKLYFNISKGFISKEDARKALSEVGLVMFSPTDAKEITLPFELHHKGFVVVIYIDEIELRKGMEIIIDKNGWYKSGLIEELQIDGSTVNTVNIGEVGVRLSAQIEKGSRLWIKQAKRDEI